MYDVKKIEEEFFPMVGWRQSDDSNRQISERLTTSQTGLTYNAEHPLLTLENLRNHAPDFRQYGYAEYNPATTYLIGNRIGYLSDVWEATQETTGNTPTELSEYWERVDLFSEWLERMTREGIQKAINQYISRRMEVLATRNLLERRQFFDGVGNIHAVVKDRSRLVGFEISSRHSYGVTIKVEKVGLQFTGPCSFPLYVFHSSQFEPIRTIDVSVTGNGYTWIDTPDLYLPYMSDDINAGGLWFICYNQDDIPNGIEAVNFGPNWQACSTCSTRNRAIWDLFSANMDVNTFFVAQGKFDTDTPKMWDINDTCYTNETNYGMNFQLTVGCDVTEFIISNRYAFKMLIAKQVAAHLLRFMAYNPEVKINRHEANVQRHEYLYEIDGNTQGRPSGIMFELEREYKAVNVDTSGIDRVCLPCTKRGVYIRGI